MQSLTASVRYDEIPTGPSSVKAWTVRVAALLMATLGWGVWQWIPPALHAWLIANPMASALFEEVGLLILLTYCFQAFAGASLLVGGGGLLGLWPNRLAYILMRAGLYAVYLTVALYLIATGIGYSTAVGAKVEVAGKVPDRVSALLIWWEISWPAMAIALYAVWLQAMLKTRAVYSVFSKSEGQPMDGDLTLEDLRTHGPGERHRKSLYRSIATHVLVLIVIPWILQMAGCVEAYRLPKGSGNPVVAMVKMVKPKKKKKEKLILRPNSAIIYAMPDIDDSDLSEQMKEATKLTYQANPNGVPGNLGAGGGTEGGFPAGMEDYKIRFIRLEHGGNGWDDGMDDPTGADVNFLQAFRDASGFRKIAKKGESHSIAFLSKYPEDGFPPFVYLTGNGSMGRVGAGDRKVLREYCLKGGMLIADAGSPSFHHSFVQFVRQVFPDKPFIDLADDDVIFQVPNLFPDGAPAFWHHGGRRAKAIKHDGRIVLFYHPGDMNDAWKNPGFTDITPQMRDAAFNLGINLLSYSFTQWNDAVMRLRK